MASKRLLSWQRGRAVVLVLSLGLIATAVLVIVFSSGSPKPSLPGVIAPPVTVNSKPDSAVVAEASKTILVHFKAGTTIARQNAAIAAAGGKRVRAIKDVGVVVVQVPVAKKAAKAIKSLNGSSSVAYAERDGVAQADTSSSVIVNDPYLNSSSWQLANPHYPTAWALSTGDSSVIVAVLDTGVFQGHEDLASSRFVTGYDFVNSDSDPTDDRGHGTSVAGIIAAQGNNGKGIAGVCWSCKIMPVKVLGSSGSGTWSQISGGITYAVDHGARVINMSLSGTSSSTTLTNAVTYAQNHGVIVVAAAGNDNTSTLHYPAAISGVLSVGAVDSTNTKYSWADYGSWVKVDAPGCTNTITYPILPNYPNGTYTFGFCGTSAAAPFVAGLVGLALSYDPSATATEVQSAIQTTAHQTADANSVYGMVDAYTTLSALITPTAPTAAFSISPNPASGYAPLSVTFTNSSTDALSYSWTFGDGGSAQTAEPTHNYTAAGTYTAILTVTGAGGQATAQTTVNVIAPTPTAIFQAAPTIGTTPLTVRFTNSSTNATSYSWSFGDGDSSTAAEPTHIYTTAGTFVVTLTATGEGGTDMAEATISVSLPPPPAPTASFTTSPSSASGVVPLSVTFTNNSTDAAYYSWDFGDGESSTQAEPTHIYTSVGTYMVVLTATGAGGEVTSQTTITVVNRPDLIVTLAASDSNPAVGQRVAIALSIRNKVGAGPASGVTLTIPLPNQLTFVSASAQPGQSCHYADGEIICNLGNIAAGGRKRGYVWVKAKTTSEIEVVATASEQQTDAFTGDNVASITLGR